MEEMDKVFSSEIRLRLHPSWKPNRGGTGRVIRAIEGALPVHTDQNGGPARGLLPAGDAGLGRPRFPGRSGDESLAEYLWLVRIKTVTADPAIAAVQPAAGTNLGFCR